MLLRDGFPGQRLRVLPRPVVAAALRQPVTADVVVTDAGYFPRAAQHGRSRASGADEAVVIVCTSGRGSCATASGELAVRAGQALVIPPRARHAYRASPADPWTIWWAHVTGARAGAPVALVCPDGAPRVVDLHEPLRTQSLVDEAITLLERDETRASLLAASGVGWALLTQLAADAVAGGRAPVEPVRQAQEHLRRHLEQPVRVPELARAAGLSTSHFSALFRAATGGGVLEYAKRLRMARACELLITSTRTVAEVASAVGYEDPFYFSRQFRAVHGCSPLRYRAEHGHGHGGAEPV
ncbi:AraC family transcriptional regulator [Pseudokineococcus marinus]|uniref:AraC family transcriptional regulator n=1 Tax=Pseudokineococcus marinus TaxID=351215 RepID=UPI001BB2EA50|nr:AraC family transcriptional regulator [Pseudokineococcus marinus]